MGSHAHEFKPSAEQFVFPNKLKMASYAMIGIGVIAMAIAFFTDKQRFWANYLLSNWYFFGLSMAGTIFIALQSVTNASWSVGFKRIPEAFGAYLPVAFIAFILIFFGLHDLYHWSHHGIADPSSEHFDEIIAKKVAYLNVPFFLIRLVLAFAAWILFTNALRKNSLREDTEGGYAFLKKNKTISSAFIVVYAVTWAMISWDLVMSIDTHWFSTIFWVLQFASAWVGGCSAIAIILVLLRKNGYLKFVNDSHVHDMGKLMFAFSIFWTYIWLSQFLLTYYANIPEEAVYYHERFDNFKVLFFANLLLNFVAPFFLFMTRDAKRKETGILVVGVIILIGRYVDQYLAIMPGTVGHHASFGIPEIGMFIGSMGLFLLIVLNTLSKHSLVPVKHPYLKEFTYHHI